MTSLTLSAIGGACLLVALPGTAFLVLYLALRLAGKLGVGADGCHASGFSWRGQPWLTPSRVFSLFRPAMEAEARVRRRFRRKAKADMAVSEVEVEIVLL